MEKVERLYRKKNGVITKENFEIYKEKLNKEALDLLKKKHYNTNELSIYAKVCMSKLEFDEVVTEISVADILKGGDV